MNASWSVAQGLRYGGVSAALAFVALPLYVLLPNYYAREFGVSLAALGTVLLGVRLLDALVDPLLGRWVDRLFARSIQAIWATAAVFAALLAIGFIAIFFPQVPQHAVLLWLGAALALTYVAYSFISIAHQSWGARFGGDASFRARVAAWREAPGLLGVLLASALPVAFGLPVMLGAFVALLALSIWLWAGAPRPSLSSAAVAQPSDLFQPWRNPRFRLLLAVFVLNGIASAVPATLVLFYVQDMLQAPKELEAVFLVVYFIAGAVAIPLWMQLVKRLGLAQGWLLSMALSVLVFIWAALLGAGDVWPYMAVCALSGIALGADLAFPSALLTGAIAAQSDQGQHEGAYIGWWNFATKLNMALAAGLALPLLDVFGYQPGRRSEQALHALILAYCVLPCVLKLAAAALLWRPARQGVLT